MTRTIISISRRKGQASFVNIYPCNRGESHRMTSKGDTLRGPCLTLSIAIIIMSKTWYASVMSRPQLSVSLWMASYIKSLNAFDKFQFI